MKKLLPLALFIALLSGCKLVPQSQPPQATTTPMPIVIEIPLQPDGSPSSGNVFSAEASFKVPPGKPPVIDGEISEDEWARADVYPVDTAAKLFLMHSEGYLYLALRTTAPARPHICLAETSRITILQADKGLQAAIYEYHDDDWWLQKPFTSCCQEGTDPSTLQMFLTLAGWTASTAQMGLPNDHEYQIAMPNDLVTLAVALEVNQKPQYALWPPSMKGECIFPNKTSTELIAPFEPRTWITLLPQQ